MLNAAHIWPISAEVRSGRLYLGGCDTVALADAYGTPLYLLDEATVRGAMRAYQTAFGSTGLQVRIHYASKALLNLALAQIVAQEGLGLDVVSGTELLVARRAGLPMAHVHMHGNAKSDAEMERALTWGVGSLVVDNLDELARLAQLSAGRSQPQGVLLRLAPEIEAATHAHIATGGSGSKFGLPLAALPAAVQQLLATPSLRLDGLHAHIGSQLFALDELCATLEVLVQAAAQVQRDYKLTMRELSPGGGLGVPYTATQPLPDLTEYAARLAQTLRSACAAHGLPLPRLTLEPGRSIVARAGVALYRVVARKVQHGQVQYLHIDGGMADNLRPALYGANYSALLANQASAPPGPPVAVAGRYCEAGDVLLRDAALPPAVPGDLLAVATTGAYTLSMASNYNLTPRPALLLLGNGSAQLIQRREREEDLLARDHVLG
ncbi:diaminopimelate decarboxylase [Candidatus Viridilinea mediisalina]|uniref:Diaminopimelate decarboxylase n=1 Tax=Candidatus Viridilinea mediisalina TaxID=2024553 RepID=A0A2A6RFX3_9CHLR|nr:diaminopimelate decarboxylase [Candidatus Viridilinea mediisalina]PDW01760.1 diaminopimelate decarboxylase [Candidatus Viridilinea mediisalina]